MINDDLKLKVRTICKLNKLVQELIKLQANLSFHLMPDEMKEDRRIDIFNFLGKNLRLMFDQYG